MKQTDFIGCSLRLAFAVFAVALISSPTVSAADEPSASPRTALELYSLVRPKLSAPAAVYILKKIAGLENQAIDRIEISREPQGMAKTFERGLERIKVQVVLPERAPASDARFVELNGQKVEYSQTDSLEAKWSKLKVVVEASYKPERPHHFSRPSAAAEFELEELPTEWMSSPFSFAGPRSVGGMNRELFTLLALIEIESAKK